MKATLYLAIAICLMSINSCVKDPDNGCVSEVLVITEDISAPTIWEGCKVYLISANQISVNSTLTIEPGAVLKFAQIAGSNAILVGNSGSIIAEGTAAKPIFFTSAKDDANGGDTNGDGNATAPSRGDWGGIIINSNSCVFSNCNFYYGGEGDVSGVAQSTLEFSFYYGKIDKCTFAHCGGETTYNGYGVVDAVSCHDSRFQLTNSVFYDCIKPVRVSCFLSMGNSNTFHNPANPSETNQLNAIFMASESNSTPSDISWSETEVPFVLTGSMYLGSGYKLILSSNVIIKMAFPPNTPGFEKISLNHNTSSIEGNSLSGVFFTSYYDDSHGGDSNGDIGGSAPSPGDWYGIQDVTATITTNNYCYNWSNILFRVYP